MGTSKHALSDLVGKKIKSILCQEIDMQSDGQNVRQFYLMTLTDGDRVVLSADGNNTQQYATIELMDVDEFSALLEEHGVETKSPSDEDDEDNESPEEDEDSNEGSWNLSDDDDDDHGDGHWMLPDDDDEDELGD